MNRWLQWKISLDREDNSIYIGLWECEQKEYILLLPSINIICSKMIKIRFWMNYSYICRMINKEQKRMLCKYVKMSKKWNFINKNIIKNFNGGKIVLEDKRTNDFIEQKINESKKLKIIK